MKDMIDDSIDTFENWWGALTLLPGEVAELVVDGIKWLVGRLFAIGLWFMGILSILDNFAAELMRNIWTILFDSPETLLIMVGIIKGLWPLALKLFAAILSLKIAVIIPAALAFGWAGLIAWRRIKDKIELMKRRRWRAKKV